jgi:hypothetical protein
VEVPSGTYDLEVSVDLSPVFGVIEHKDKVVVEQPGADVLEQRLKELASEDANVRRQAVLDLRYFKEDAARVVPALLGRLEDPDASNVRMVLSVLMAYPEEAGGSATTFLRFLKSDDVSMRSMAAQLLGRVAPRSEEIEKALEAALAAAPENMKPAFEYGLSTYRRRHAPAEPQAGQ